MSNENAPRMVSGENTPEDDGALDRALRPQRLDDLIGQDKVRDNMRTMIEAAKKRGEALDHILIYGPPGLGKCIVGDSLVLSDQGIEPLQRYVPNALMPDEAQPCQITIASHAGLDQTSHIYASGFGATIRLKTRSGFELEGTPNHPVWVATAEGPQWKTLDTLTPDDYVAVACDTQLWGSMQAIQFRPASPSIAVRKAQTDVQVADLHARLTEALERYPTGRELHLAYSGAINKNGTPILAAKRQGLPILDGRVVKPQDYSHILLSRLDDQTLAECDDRQWPSILDEDLAYVMGLLVGDGHFEQPGSNYPACDITATEVEIQHEVQRICQAQFGWVPSVRQYESRAPRIRFSQNFGHFMIALGMKPVLAADKVIPDAVLKSPAQVVRGFLQGLFDADGHAWSKDGYIDLCSKSATLIRQVQIVLANFGIIAHRTSKVRKEGTYWYLFIGGADAQLFYERVGFRLTRKQQTHAKLTQKARGKLRRDAVPLSNVLLSQLLDATRPHSRSLHKKFDHAKRGDRVLTRGQVAALLAHLPATVQTMPQYAILQALCAKNIYWDRISDLVESQAETYDFCVPRSHSFVANAFYNHNTTLSHILANEMSANLRVTSGPAIERAGDLAAILTNLRANDVLFIDEIHRLNRTVEEFLYPAMEDYAIDIVVGKGPSARSVRLKLPPITIVGATTRLALMTAPLRARFGAQFRVDFYPVEALELIVSRAARLLQSPIDSPALNEVARRARGTPRVALRLLKRVRDFAQVKGDGRITPEIAHLALSQLEIDPLGLDDIDRRVLLAIIQKFNGGPVGLETIAASISEEGDTIMDVVEPYLLTLGFLDRTPRGRVATARAYEHLHIPYNPPPGQASLL